jgi:glycosyltransferase involved in cell wall biosynthesis
MPFPATPEVEPRVLFVLEWMPAYRVEFFSSLDEALRDRGIRLLVAHGEPTADVAARSDARDLPGAIQRPSKVVSFGSRSLVWQPFRTEARSFDLAVLNEGSRFLLNYLLLADQFRGRARAAFWGNGANLNELDASWLAERIKRPLYRLPHWYFAYTEGSRDRISGLGFPAERITVVQNAVSTETVCREIGEVGADDVHAMRIELGLEEGMLGLFLGSLRAPRRLGFLLEAADQIAAARPDFTLVVAGDGPDREKFAAQVARRPNVRMVGRVDGVRKAVLLSAADLLLLPGGIGLNIVEGFAAGVPTVSTALPTHAPEVEYLRDGVNGRMLPADTSPREYAQAALDLFNHPSRLSDLSRGAAEAAQVYTNEAMVSRVAAGVVSALHANPRQNPLRALR